MTKVNLVLLEFLRSCQFCLSSVGWKLGHYDRSQINLLLFLEINKGFIGRPGQLILCIPGMQGSNSQVKQYQYYSLRYCTTRNLHKSEECHRFGQWWLHSVRSSTEEHEEWPVVVGDCDKPPFIIIIIITRNVYHHHPPTTEHKDDERKKSPVRDLVLDYCDRIIQTEAAATSRFCCCFLSLSSTRAERHHCSRDDRSGFIL